MNDNLICPIGAKIFIIPFEDCSPKIFSNRLDARDYLIGEWKKNGQRADDLEAPFRYIEEYIVE